MKRSAILLIAVLLFAALAAGACGKKAEPGTTGEATAIPTRAAKAVAVAEATEAPEAVEATEPTVAPEPTSAEEADLSVDDRQSGLDKYDSYKAAFSMNWQGTEDGEQKTGKWGWSEEIVREPRASRLIWGVESSDQGASNMEIVEVNGTSYSVMSGADGKRTCLAAMSGDESTTSGMFSPSTLGSVSNARFVGRENLNGIPVRHYRYSEQGAALAGFGNLKGEIWVSVDDETVLKETATWEGGAGLFGLGATAADGKGSWTWEVTEINQPMDIKPPEECATASSELPILPDATDKFQAGDTVMYSSATALDKVIEFYRNEMEAAGWQEQEGGTTTEDMAMLTFTKEAMTAQLIASRQDNVTGVSITITK